MLIGILIACGLLAAVLIGAALYLFPYAIVSKHYTKHQVESEDFEMSAEIRAYYDQCAEWFDSAGFEVMEISVRDGVCLRGYYLPAETRQKKLAVLAHGYEVGAKAMSEFARFYHQEGFDVFMADARGHGESGGRYIGMGWLDRLDYLEWLDLLIRRVGSDGQIVLHGVSMGAATVMMMSGESLPFQVKGVIADCGYTSAFDEFRIQIKRMFHLPAFPLLYLGGAVCRIFAGYGFREASALEQVKKAQIPMLFVHGKKDRFIPPMMAVKLYRAASATKELWLVPDAGHARSYYYDPNTYQRKIRDFCAYCFAPEETDGNDFFGSR